MNCLRSREELIMTLDETLQFDLLILDMKLGGIDGDENDVVENMEDDDSSRQKQKRMSQNQRLIQESNDKIASLEDELLEVPRELARANEKLLTETLKACYDRMNANTEDIEVLDKWINATRVKLKKNILIKQDKETVNNNMYSLIHDIIGPENCSAVDRINEGNVGDKQE